MQHANYPLSIGAALIAGLCLAATGVLQQKEASKTSEKKSLSVALLWDLVHDRVWLFGMLFGVLSYAFQGVALAFGPLAVVQPVVLSELIFAVPISVRRHGMHLCPRDWAAIFAVAGGLAVGIVSSSPSAGNPLPSLTAWSIAIGGVAIVTVIALGIGKTLHGPVRASMFALASATVLALQSAFLSATTAYMKHGILEIFTHWEPYALVPSTAIGILLMQSAYQAGPLASSMPVVDAWEPSVAIVLGVALFGEHIATGTWNLLGTAIGLAGFFVGVISLDTSPLVRRVQRMEEKERETADA